MSRYLNKIFVTFLIPLSGHISTIVFFWPLYGYIPNAKTFLFSYVRMKNPNFKSENIKDKIIVLWSKLCLKLFIYLGSRSDIFNDYRHISRAITM